MQILIVGSGGREHALAWKAAQSEQVETVYVAPGNAGTAMESKCKNVDIGVDDMEALASFAKENNVAMTIIGPEQPLVDGIVDHFQSEGLKCFGPSKAASRLEGSKAFTKAFLKQNNIPTADYQAFNDVDEALAYIDEKGAPIVIKADGLAAGKGVVVAMSVDEARQSVIDMLANNKFGAAGSRVIIEEFLTGEEVSFIAMVANDQILPMASSQDHKALNNGDTGPNTGGMGAYSPAPVMTEALYDKVMTQIMMPTVQGLLNQGMPYVGFLYAGLMIDHKGEPKVLEYNCRFGDPETQPIMMRLQSDIVALCEAALDGKLNAQNIQWDPRPALGVVMAAGGYPGNYTKGDEITGFPEESATLKVFHAGTANRKNKIVSNGGRVLCVTALGDTVLKAQLQAYAAVRNISWDGAYYRSDIGYRAVAREAG